MEITPLIVTQHTHIRTSNTIINNYSYRHINLLILISVSLGIIVDGIEMTLMSLFVIPIQSYYNLNQFQMQVISSVLFLGVAFGSYISLYIVHKYSRAYALSMSYNVLLFSHIGLAFSFNYISFTLFRFIIGAALGVIVPVSLNLMSEYINDKHTSLLLTSIWAFFSLGQGMQALFMYIGMPNLETNRMKWVIASLVLFIIIAKVVNDNYIMDSPSHLLMRNEHDKAFDILDTMLTEMNDVPLNDNEKTYMKQHNVIVIKKEQISIDELFTEERYIGTLLQICLMFILSFIFYGVMLVSTLTMRSLNLNELNDVNYTRIILDQIFVAFISMPGNIIGGILCNIPKIGTKNTIILGFIISALCAFAIILFRSNYTTLYSIYLFFVDISFNVCLTYVVETHPIHLRDTSSGFLFSCLRISGFFSQYLYIALHYWGYLVPYYYSGLLCVIAIIITYNLN